MMRLLKQMVGMQPDLPEPSQTKPLEPDATSAAGSLSQWQLICIQFSRHHLAVGALYVLVFLYLLAIFAEFLSPNDPHKRYLDYQFCPPQTLHWSPSKGLHARVMELEVDPVTLRRTYMEKKDEVVPLGFFVTGSPYRLWGLIPMETHFFGVSATEAGESPMPAFFLLGTDRYGRDILSRAIHGARVSLSVGLVGITFTFLFGMTIGGISGYVGGRIDNLIQRSIEIINSFPHLPLWLALAALMPPEWSPLRVYFAITIVLSLLGWTGLARVVRGKILSLREEDYAVAARLAGASHGRILFRHLLPGFTSHIIVALSLAVPSMILAETSLSFLGLGLRPPIVSWGVMLQDCMDVQAVRFYPWLMIPVVFIVAAVLCFNFVGDGLRDAADPYSTK